jgi:hypothetical protein
MSRSREVFLAFADWAANTPLMRDGVAAQPSERRRALLHQPPEMSVMIDETEADPRAVREFSGQPLITVIDGDALDERMLHIFSSNQQAAAYVEAAESPVERAPSQQHTTRVDGLDARGSLTQALTAGPPPGMGFYDMYDLEGLGGCYWRILEFDGLTFNYDTRWACGFLWWGWISADMRVSSIDSYVSADHVLIQDQLMPTLNPSILWMTTGNFRINSLARFGWNNRARSQFHLYM